MGLSQATGDSIEGEPCAQCGACCLSYRVDFAVQQLQSQGGCVPDGLAQTLNDYTARMRGTDYAPPRCAAWTGALGQRSACGIYEWRPNPCHELSVGSDACQRARRIHGLAPL